MNETTGQGQEQGQELPKTPSKFKMPNALPAAVTSRLNAEVKTQDSPPATDKFAMSPKQTKLLGRLNELMKNFKELKKRVKTMQSTGDTIVPDKQLFEKYKEKKEQEIARMEDDIEELGEVNRGLEQKNQDLDRRVQALEDETKILKSTHEEILAKEREEHEAKIAELNRKHALDLESRLKAAVERAKAEKEAEMLEIEFEVSQEMKKDLVVTRRESEIERQERRRKSVENTINRSLDEYPEDLRMMLGPGLSLE